LPVSAFGENARSHFVANCSGEGVTADDVHIRAKHLNEQCLAGWGDETNVGKFNDNVPSCSHFLPGPAKFRDIWVCQPSFEAKDGAGTSLF
jgi:hypothetical protein